MDKINCNIGIVGDNISINGISDADIQIDISGDIDFTELVSILAQKIDEKKSFDLNINDEGNIDDEKQKLVIETIKEIFTNYNETIVEESEETDNLPF